MFDPQLKKILAFSVKDRYQLNYFICIKDFNAETIGIIHRFSRLVTLLFHKWLIVRLNHKDACILTLT
jgi:hypothetical protein